MNRCLVVGVVVSALACADASAGLVSWDGSSGLLPNQIPERFSLFDNATADPSLSGGTLTLSSSQGDADILGYRHTGDVLSMPPKLVIETRMRFVSGTSMVNFRAPAGVQFVVAPSILNFLWIEEDTIFLNGPGDTRGPSANVDTNDAFHTYRIEVDGASVGSEVNVFYDNGASPVLTGALFSLTSPELNVSWGDLSEAVGGVSEWQTFEHNAFVPEPSCLALLSVAGLGAVGGRLRRRRRRV